MVYLIYISTTVFEYALQNIYNKIKGEIRVKFFKKAARILVSAMAAVTAAAAICAQASATELITPQAQNDLYRLYMVTEPETPEAGSTITLKVMADTYGNTAISALKYRIEFNTGNYEYVRGDGAAFNPLIDDSNANNGYIIYNYAGGALQIKGRAQEIISFSFNVKKPTGEFIFGATDRSVTDSGGADITTQGSWVPITWDQCNHEEYVIQVTKEPTCTTTGISSYICTKCRVSFNSAIIPALGHDWDRTKGTYTTAPTCTAAGTVSYPCSRQGCTATQTETVPAMGHNWGSWTVTKPATAYEEGEETRNCTRCSASERRTVARNPSVTTAASSTSATNQVSVLPTQLLDLENGVILQFRAGTVDSRTTLVVKKTDQNQTSAKYDITLSRYGYTVQPTDTLYITIYIPAGMSGSTFYVYRVEENGGYTDMGAAYSGSAVNFRTGHLSEYILTTEKLIDTDALGTTAGTAANPPAPATTTPAPSTAATTTRPSAVSFESTTPVATPDTTAPPAVSSNTTTTSPDVVWDGTTPPPSTANTGNTGNTGNTVPDDKSQDKNVSTGMLALSIPLIAAAVGIFVAKKR